MEIRTLGEETTWNHSLNVCIQPVLRKWMGFPSRRCTLSGLEMRSEMKGPAHIMPIKTRYVTRETDPAESSLIFKPKMIAPPTTGAAARWSYELYLRLLRK